MQFKFKDNQTGRILTADFPDVTSPDQLTDQDYTDLQAEADRQAQQAKQFAHPPEAEGPPLVAPPIKAPEVPKPNLMMEAATETRPETVSAPASSTAMPIKPPAPQAPAVDVGAFAPAEIKEGTAIPEGLEAAPGRDVSETPGKFTAPTPLPKIEEAVKAGPKPEELLRMGPELERQTNVPAAPMREHEHEWNKAAVGLTQALVSGTGTFVSGVTKIPPTVVDAVLMGVNKMDKLINKIAGTNLPEEGGKLPPEAYSNSLSDFFKELEPGYDVLKQYSNRNIIDDIKNKNLAGAGFQLALNVAGMTPIMIGAVMTGNPVLAGAGFGVETAAEKWSGYVDRAAAGEQVTSREAAMLGSLADGTIVGVLSSVGPFGVLEHLMDTYKATAAKAGEDVAKKVIQNTLAHMIKVATQEGGVNLATGFGMTAGQGVVDKVTGLRPDATWNQIVKEGVNSGLIFAAQGGLMGGVRGREEARLSQGLDAMESIKKAIENEAKPEAPEASSLAELNMTAEEFADKCKADGVVPDVINKFSDADKALVVSALRRPEKPVSKEAVEKAPAEIVTPVTGTLEPAAAEPPKKPEVATTPVAAEPEPSAAPAPIEAPKATEPVKPAKPRKKSRTVKQMLDDVNARKEKLKAAKAPETAELPAPVKVPEKEPEPPLPEALAPAQEVNKRQAAVDMGYRFRTVGHGVARSEIRSPEDAADLNAVADDVERAYYNREGFSSEKLASTIKRYEDANFQFRIDDPEVEGWIKAISNQLREDGYTVSGKKAQVRSGEGFEEREESKMDLWRRREMAKERQAIWNRRYKKWGGDITKDPEFVPDYELESLAEQIKGKSIKAIARSFQITETRTGQKVLESVASKAAPQGPPRTPIEVALVAKSVLDYYFRGPVKGLRVTLADLPLNSEGVQIEGRLSMYPDGTALVEIHRGITAERLRDVMTHEILGHFGLGQIVGADPKILNVLNGEYNKELNAFKKDYEGFDDKPKEQQTAILKKHNAIAKHVPEHEKKMKELGAAGADEWMFNEWLATHSERYDKAYTRNPTNSKVAFLIKSAIAKLFKAVGIRPEKTELDRALGQLVDRIRSERKKFLKTVEGPTTKKGMKTEDFLKENEAKEGGKEKPVMTPDDFLKKYDAELEAAKSKLAAKNLAKEWIDNAFSGMTDISKYTAFKEVVLTWQARIQQISQRAKNMEESIKKLVPDVLKRRAMTVYREAGGDEKLIKSWADKTPNKVIKLDYTNALRLNDSEKELVRTIGEEYDRLLKDAQDLGLLEEGRKNYINRIVDPNGTHNTGYSAKLINRMRAQNRRKFEFAFDAEQAGYKIATKDVAELLGIYESEMGRVIATRKLIKDLTTKEIGLDEKGEPIPLTTVVGSLPTQGDPNKPDAYLIKPNSKGDHSDYVTIENDALKKWKYVGETEAGTPVVMQANIAIHPSVAKHLERILSGSMIRAEAAKGEPGIGEAVRFGIRNIDYVQSLVKQAMFSFSGFHWVQEGTHAIGHRVNPFWGIPTIDLVNNAAHMRAAEHGLMLMGDHDAAKSMREGLASGDLMYKIPYLGNVARIISEPLFNWYIPGLKYKTYEHILERNTKLFAKEMKSGKTTLDDVEYLSAQQANAAYGHLNYTDIYGEWARNPTTQHILRTIMLAPDFFEARARFAAQAAKAPIGFAGDIAKNIAKFKRGERDFDWSHGKAGLEQLNALLVLTAVFGITPAIINKFIDGDSHIADAPFTIVYKNRRYKMRTVPGDLVHLFTNYHQFIAGRVSPIVGRTAQWMLTQRDYRGMPEDAKQFLIESMFTAFPISSGGPVALAEKVLPKPAGETISALPINRNKDISAFESFLNAMGIAVSRYSPLTQIYSELDDWKKSHGLLEEAGIYPPSKYRDVRNALQDDNIRLARTEWDRLVKHEVGKGLETEDMVKAKLWKGFYASVTKPLTGSSRTDTEFRASLRPDKQAWFDYAQAERQNLLPKFFEMFPELKESNNGQNQTGK